MRHNVFVFWLILFKCKSSAGCLMLLRPSLQSWLASLHSKTWGKWKADFCVFSIHHLQKPDNSNALHMSRVCISARRKEMDFCDGGGWSNILRDMSPQALEKAKEASRKERTLVRQREQSDKADQINIDLYGSVSNTGAAFALEQRILCWIDLTLLILFHPQF